jgi:alpha-beta hydrolase superfamily lysophospholipase
VVEAYVNDPLVYTGKVTARLGAEMLKTMQDVTNNAARIKLPLTIVQGSDDILIDPGGAQLLFDSVSSEDKSIKVYEGFYHEVFNEPEHGQVLNDVRKWIEARLGKR